MTLLMKMKMIMMLILVVVCECMAFYNDKDINDENIDDVNYGHITNTKANTIIQIGANIVWALPKMFEIKR